MNKIKQIPDFPDYLITDKGNIFSTLYGTEHLRGGAKGEYNGRAKLKWSELIIINKCKTTKTSQRKLAKEYNVSQRAFYSILTNKSWKR